jgi:hypothetical protein
MLKDAQPEDVIDIHYINDAEISVDKDGETVFAVSWVECPVLRQKRIVMRTAASLETAERICRKLMDALGIQGKEDAERKSSAAASPGKGNNNI